MVPQDVHTGAKNKKAVGSYQSAHGLFFGYLKKSRAVKADLAAKVKAKAKKHEKSAYAVSVFKFAIHDEIS